MAAANRRKELAALPGAYLQCRDITHAWQPYTVTDEPGGIWRQTVICGSCGQTKNRLVRRRNGGIIRDWQLNYTKGYLIKGGRLDGDERNEVRRLNVRAGFQVSLDRS